MCKKFIVTITALICTLAAAAQTTPTDYAAPHPFGQDTEWAKDADNVAIGEWWKPNENDKQPERDMREWLDQRPL